MWTAPEFSQLVHRTSPTFPPLLHRFAHRLVHRFWITLVDNL